MKRAHLIPILLLGLVLSVGGYALRAEARPTGDLALFTMLNGEVTKLGVLASTGTSVNNSTTGTAFTVLPADCPGRILLFDCDAAGASIGNGTTCSDSITNANYKPATAAAHEWKYFVLKDATTLICLDTPATTVNCAVFCLN